MIDLLRVDHRLIHGQVAVGWLRTLGSNAILIANDDIPGDELRKATLKMAKPAETKLVIKTMADSIAAINSGKTDTYRLFIVVETVAAAVQLASACPAIRHINLGGTRKKEGTRQVTNTVFLTQADLDGLSGVAAGGVEVEARVLPNDKKVPLAQIATSF